MSDYQVRNERDHVSVRSVVLWILFTLVLFAIGGITVVLQQKSDWGTLQNKFTATPEVQKDMVGMIYQHPFEHDYGLRTNDAARKSLTVLKYSDDKHETAQIPIERAMELFVKKGGTL